jgi:hypothetical protein
MHRVTTHHRVPKAGVDPIDRAELGLATVLMAATRPMRPEVVAVVLDHSRRGIGVVVVSGATDPDAAVDVVELLTHPAAHRVDVGAVILGTVRPGGAMLPDDVDRWLDASDIAESHGVELVEWFVIGDRIECPRDLFGEPPRW